MFGGGHLRVPHQTERLKNFATLWSDIFARFGYNTFKLGKLPASFPVVLGCDVTFQACRENSLGSKPPLVTRIARTGLGTSLVSYLILRPSFQQCRWIFAYYYLNPLSPKSDQRQISPCNITALLKQSGHENYGHDHKR